MALVSILIVNFRSYGELMSCLASIRRFATAGTPIVVVDHESRPAPADGLRREFPGIELIDRRDNPGFAAGVNRAVRASSSPYFLLLNPDCTLDGDVTSALAAWMDANPRVGAC